MSEKGMPREMTMEEDRLWRQQEFLDLPSQKDFDRRVEEVVRNLVRTQAWQQYWVREYRRKLESSSTRFEHEGGEIFDQDYARRRTAAREDARKEQAIKRQIYTDTLRNSESERLFLGKCINEDMAPRSVNWGIARKIEQILETYDPASQMASRMKKMRAQAIPQVTPKATPKAAARKKRKK